MQGGLRAVVWTDLFQGLVMIGGLVAIIVQERTDRRRWMDRRRRRPQTRKRHGRRRVHHCIAAARAFPGRTCRK